MRAGKRSIENTTEEQFVYNFESRFLCLKLDSCVRWYSKHNHSDIDWWRTIWNCKLCVIKTKHDFSVIDTVNRGACTENVFSSFFNNFSSRRSNYGYNLWGNDMDHEPICSEIPTSWWKLEFYKVSGDNLPFNPVFFSLSLPIL